MGPRTGAENLAPTWIPSPGHPARNESLYRLSYSGAHLCILAGLIDKAPLFISQASAYAFIAVEAVESRVRVRTPSVDTHWWQRHVLSNRASNKRGAIKFSLLWLVETGTF
jgi:hypothetical protein